MYLISFPCKINLFNFISSQKENLKENRHDYKDFYQIFEI